MLWLRELELVSYSLPSFFDVTLQPGSRAARQPGSRAAGQPGSRAAGRPGGRVAGRPGKPAAAKGAGDEVELLASKGLDEAALAL